MGATIKYGYLGIPPRLDYYQLSLTLIGIRIIDFNGSCCRLRLACQGSSSKRAASRPSRIDSQRQTDLSVSPFRALWLRADKARRLALTRAPYGVLSRIASLAKVLPSETLALSTVQTGVAWSHVRRETLLQALCGESRRATTARTRSERPTSVTGSDQFVPRRVCGQRSIRT